jgi:hypothetical protein
MRPLTAAEIRDFYLHYRQELSDAILTPGGEGGESLAAIDAHSVSGFTLVDNYVSDASILTIASLTQSLSLVFGFGHRSDSTP